LEQLISKLLPVFLYPLGFAIILGIFAAFLLSFGRKKVAVLSILASISVLWVCATPAFSNYLLDSLEQKYPPVMLENLPKVDAIVILGGAVGGIAYKDNLLNLDMSVDRVFYGMELYKKEKAPKIILSGGSILGEISEAEMMANLLQKFKVDENDILLETDSRNTHENAINTLEITQQHNINQVILVTSAFHMRRALATFRSLGIDAVPAATDYNVQYSEFRILNWLPDALYLHRTTYSFKEYMGWWVYNARGWIKN